MVNCIGLCMHYDCTNRNSFGYCKTTACINQNYQHEQWISTSNRTDKVIVKPQTNADRIRAMSDEELADWMSEIARCDCCPAKPCKSLWHCEEQWLDWLKQEV